MSLEGRIALVTGGGSGIGRATALRLAEDDDDGVVLDLNLDGARETVARLEKLGRRGVALRADVTRSDEVRAALEQAVRALGPIDVLVNNAGLAWLASFLEMPEQDWDRMLAVHLKGAYNCTRAVLPGMLERRWGRIVSLSSIAGLGGTGRSVAYATAKAALIGFTKSLAREVAPHGVTVNAVARVHRHPDDLHLARRPPRSRGRGDPGPPRRHSRRHRPRHRLPRLRGGQLRHRPGAQPQRRPLYVGSDV